LGAASPAHFSVQVEEEQLSEQLPVQVTAQVAPAPHEMLPLLPSVAVQFDASQETLPLAPTVRLQVLPALQLLLQEPAQVPVQVLWSRQASEQLPPEASQPVPAHEQAAPAAHEQAEPLQAHASPGQVVALLPPQPASSAVKSAVRTRARTALATGCSWGWRRCNIP
jgi:hypothetical protein